MTVSKANGEAIVIMRVVLTITLMREMVTVAIKLTAMMMKVAEKEEEVVLRVFLRCPTYCEALTRSSAVAIVSESFEGFVC